MANKTGYLHEPLRLFYLSDQKDWECPYHYHDFDKITLFLRGHVSYDIEGKSYALQPWDIIVVPAGLLHRPVISGDATYERIIAYISPAYRQLFQRRGCDTTAIFAKTASPVFRQHAHSGPLYDALCRLRQAGANEEGIFLMETIFQEFLIYFIGEKSQKNAAYVKARIPNRKIEEIMAYIDGHVTDGLSIPSLSRQFFMSPDYLMHLFKSETGYTVNQYITLKRLSLARTLMEKGQSLTTVCYDSGFKNYSSFYRAWKSTFHTSPRQGATRTGNMTMLE